MSDESIPPPQILSRKQLGLATLVVIVFPMIFVAWMAFGLNPKPEPKLEASITVGVMAWSPDQSAERTRLVPALILVNQSQEPWGNVSIALNDQFFFYRREILNGGEEVRIPLEFFSTKGNQRFHPPSNKLTEVTLYAQLPSGARGVKEQPFE
jgi:hypothetical protein